MSVGRPTLIDWAPRSFVAKCAVLGREGIAEALDGSPVLLVELDERGGELETTLAAISPFDDKLGASPAGNNLGFKTELRDINAVLVQMGQQRSNGRGAHDGGLPSGLLSKACFVVPLSKRAGASSLFSERITVGRARNHDVVLRHRSVSKFHAWFERSEDGVMTVADAGSSNHTYVDDRQLTNEPVRLRVGAFVRFGSVQAHYAPLDALWDLLGRM